MKPEDLRGEARSAFETWRTIGLSESAAMSEVVGAGLVEADSYDAMTGLGRDLGLSEPEARLFAIGRNGTESEARRSWSEAAAPTQPDGTKGGTKALSESERVGLSNTMQRAFADAVDSGVRFGGMREAAAARYVADRVKTALNAISADLCKPATGAQSVRLGEGGQR